jgi:hypothetical protein
VDVAGDILEMQCHEFGQVALVLDDEQIVDHVRA